MTITSWPLQNLLGTCAGFMLAILLTVQTYATDTNSPPKSTADDSIADQMIALRKQVDDAEAAYMRAPEAVSDKTWQTFCRLNQTNLPRIFQLARQEPRSETSFEMFKWIVMNRQIFMSSFKTNGVQSLVFLREYDATNPSVARLCRIVGYNWDNTCQPAIDFLRAVADKNPDRDARGQAFLALAKFKKEDADALDFWQSAPSADARFENSRSNYLATAKNETHASLSNDSEKLYHEVLDQYADCPSLARTNSWQVKATLGDIAKADLFELEHLSVGDVAPDITGRGVDGKKLQLSRYRGKIVVLSFWASWCGPCMAMVPSEVRLAERMKGKPFAIVGVNGDGRREDAKKAMEKDNATWPSFYSDNGPNGPIPTAWNVHGWPTVFILDGKGVIRFKFMGYGRDTEKTLDGKVDELLEQFGTDSLSHS
jgi:thiol-disulfide isomerase/thioredoxin